MRMGFLGYHVLRRGCTHPLTHLYKAPPSCEMRDSKPKAKPGQSQSCKRSVTNAHVKHPSSSMRPTRSLYPLPFWGPMKKAQKNAVPMPLSRGKFVLRRGDQNNSYIITIRRTQVRITSSFRRPARRFQGRKIDATSVPGTASDPTSCARPGCSLCRRCVRPAQQDRPELRRRTRRRPTSRRRWRRRWLRWGPGGARRPAWAGCTLLRRNASR